MRSYSTCAGEGVGQLSLDSSPTGQFRLAFWVRHFPPDNSPNILCIHTYTCMHYAYTHTYIHTYTHIHIHIHTYTYIYRYTYIYICMYVYEYSMYVCIHICISMPK